MMSKLLKLGLPCLLAIVALTGCSSDRAHGPARLIPMSVFFMSEDKLGFRLSPSGEYVSYLARWQSRLNLYVQKIGEDDAVRLTESTDKDIIASGWADDVRLIYFQDSGGNETYHMYCVNVDGSNRRDLTPYPQARAFPVGDLRSRNGKILVGVNHRDPRYFDVYRIDIATAEATLVFENHEGIGQYWADHDGRLRLAQRQESGRSYLYYRDTEAEPFRIVAETDILTAIDPIAFTFDNKHLYVRSHNGRDKQGLYVYDPVTNRHLELLFEHPEVDVRNALLSRKRQKLVGVTYVLDRVEDHFFDAEREKLQNTIESLVPEPMVDIYDSSEDETRFVVGTYSDKTMGVYYFYDSTTGEIQKLGEVSPWLHDEPLVDLEPVRVMARDGVELTGYLALPLGVKPKNLPAVILVHYGHWNRLTWSWNPEIQFLANRGYAVLALNYRGSIGYGAQFTSAGFRQWGRAMQDDLSDGVGWLVDRGIADPGRIGIMGWSYGGYAALAGLAFTGELYACGVVRAGIIDVVSFLEQLPPYGAMIMGLLQEWIGDPAGDREYLNEVSPLLHADRIADPVLLAHGVNDPWVSVALSDSLVSLLKAQDCEVEYLRFDDEAHTFFNIQNRYAYYRAVEEFLGRHLGGRVERVVP